MAYCWPFSSHNCHTRETGINRVWYTFLPYTQIFNIVKTSLLRKLHDIGELRDLSEIVARGWALELECDNVYD